MSKKMYEVLPFKYEYTIQNIYTGECFYTVNLSMVQHYARKLMMSEKKDKYGRKLWPREVKCYDANFLNLIAQSKWKNPHGWYEGEYKQYIDRNGKTEKYFVGYKLRKNVRPIVVYDNLGRIVSRSELAGIKMTTPDYDRSRWIRRLECSEYQRNRTNSALCKRKGDAKKVKSTWATTETVDSYGKTYYHYSPNYTHSIRVKSEQTANHAHENEYGAELVRRKRANLPNAWDGKPSTFWNCRRSWKHNSKRRKQWKTK